MISPKQQRLRVSSAGGSRWGPLRTSSPSGEALRLQRKTARIPLGSWGFGFWVLGLGPRVFTRIFSVVLSLWSLGLGVDGGEAP